MTKLNYLNDSYLFESNATIIDIKDNEKGKAIILDETIFYPQGGGQVADHGEIISDNNLFIVNDVRLDENGTVWHFGEFKNDIFNKGDKVTLKIDKERRILNTKIHSAGHLIDCAVEKMGIQNLKPAKGFHFPDGPNVEYEGIIENKDEFISDLERVTNELIAQDLKFEKKDLSFEEAKKQGIFAPPGKSVRVINFEGFSECGCGGTHVKSTLEIGEIKIKKIKVKKGITKISYNI